MWISLALLTAIVGAPRSDKPTSATRSKSQARPPELPDSAWARDVCFPDAQTIVIADWDGNSHTSRDSGQTWTSAKMGPVIRALTIDAGGVIWGFYRWHGIHEPSTASLLWSADVGTTWHQIELDPEVCMPEAFVLGGPELTLLAADGQLWIHKPDELESFTNWRRLGRPTPEGGGRAAVRVGSLAMLASSVSKIFHSSDGAESWHEVQAEPVIDFLAPLGNRSGLGPFEYLGITGTGKTITLTLEHATRGELVTCDFVSAKVGRELAQDLRVFHAVSDVQRFVLCGEARGGKALGLIADNERVRSLPGLAANQTVQVRIDGSGRPWIVGKGVYELDEKGERWVLVWPLK